MIEWAPWARLGSRCPVLGWLETWGVSLASLVLGLLTLFIFRRGLPHVGWIVGYLLLLWLLFAALTELRAALEERGRHLVVGAGEYAIQSLYHGLSLFVLPAYYAAATLDSVNALFLGRSGRRRARHGGGSVVPALRPPAALARARPVRVLDLRRPQRGPAARRRPPDPRPRGQRSPGRPRPHPRLAAATALVGWLPSPSPSGGARLPRRAARLVRPRGWCRLRRSSSRAPWRRARSRCSSRST